MKIAVCYAGLIGGTAKYGEGAQIDFAACAENYKKMVFQDHDVDVFMHTWSYRQEKPLRRLLNPVDAIFEAPIKVDVSKVRREERPNRLAECSRFNSIQKSINLALARNKEYSFYMVTRYDLLWEKPIPWETLPKDKLILSNFNKQSVPEDRKKPLVNISYPMGGPDQRRGYQDLWVIGARRHMEQLSKCYDTVVKMGNAKYSGHGILFKNLWPMFKDDVVFWGWYGPTFDLYRRKVLGCWP